MIKLFKKLDFESAHTEIGGYTSNYLRKMKFSLILNSMALDS